MFFSKVLLFLSMALAASAVATPKHNVHRRHHVKARLAAEEPVPVLAPAVTVVPRKRSIKRCKAKTSSSVIPSSTPTQAPVNVGGNLPVFSSPSASPSTTPPPAKAPPAAPPAAPTTTATPPAAPPSTGGGDAGSETHSGDGKPALTPIYKTVD